MDNACLNSAAGNVECYNYLRKRFFSNYQYIFKYECIYETAFLLLGIVNKKIKSIRNIFCVNIFILLFIVAPRLEAS